MRGERKRGKRENIRRRVKKAREAAAETDVEEVWRRKNTLHEKTSRRVAGVPVQNFPSFGRLFGDSLRAPHGANFASRVKIHLR